MSGTQIFVDPTYQSYINNGNTAFGWGNHASSGYLTSLPSHTHDYLSTTSSQALHSSDALRISGQTLYLYKGNGSQESITIPSGSASKTSGTWSPSITWHVGAGGVTYFYGYQTYGDVVIISGFMSGNTAAYIGQQVLQVSFSLPFPPATGAQYVNGAAASEDGSNIQSMEAKATVFTQLATPKLYVELIAGGSAVTYGRVPFSAVYIKA